LSFLEFVFVLPWEDDKFANESKKSLLVKVKRFLASVLSSVVNLDTDRLGNLCVDASSLQLLKSETSSKLGGLVISRKTIKD